ncbi:MAG: class I SAM-dependent rRNA methyltransferase [Desulfobacterium sp.]|nr:class I SAM-dependent rRNA methyltransferase [Desulfobacterium sp.]
MSKRQKNNLPGPQSGNTKDAVLSAKGTARAQAGHLWIYRSDLIGKPDVESGSVVRVLDYRGRFLAMAHYHEESEISLRLLSQKEETIDRNFWRSRLESATRWRMQITTNTNAYRLVHSEGDLLPGLIIDRYADSFSIQTLTRGMDLLKPMWVELLNEAFQPLLIVERNDVKVRQLEHLPLTAGLLHGNPADLGEILIEENGIRFAVDLIQGQKTGAFLDQRENRAAAMDYAHGRGLDCFSFNGSFALHLAKACETVTAIDISAPALDRARRNAALNEMENVEFLEGNVFDKLNDFEDAGERFDIVVLDPPAFAKNRAALEPAMRGYKEINLRAIKILNPGGMLITCSCSYHIGEAQFLQILKEAAKDAGRSAQIIEKRMQGRDHPILLSVPETYYLKCIVLRIL